jgi:hypothetical protein
VAQVRSAAKIAKERKSDQIARRSGVLMENLESGIIQYLLDDPIQTVSIDYLLALTPTCFARGMMKMVAPCTVVEGRREMNVPACRLFTIRPSRAR